jgi:hypothetical protein
MAARWPGTNHWKAKCAPSQRLKSPTPCAPPSILRKSPSSKQATSKRQRQHRHQRRNRFYGSAEHFYNICFALVGQALLPAGCLSRQPRRRRRLRTELEMFQWMLKSLAGRHHRPQLEIEDSTASQVRTLVPKCLVCGTDPIGHSFAQVASMPINGETKPAVMALFDHVKNHDWDRSRTSGSLEEIKITL